MSIDEPVMAVCVFRLASTRQNDIVIPVFFQVGSNVSVHDETSRMSRMSRLSESSESDTQERFTAVGKLRSASQHTPIHHCSPSSTAHHSPT